MDSNFDLKFVAFAVAHVNEDHADAMLDIGKAHHHQSSLDKVELVSYDAEKMMVNAFDHSGKTLQLEIPFVRPLQNAKEFRPVLIEMLKSAKEKLK